NNNSDNNNSDNNNSDNNNINNTYDYSNCDIDGTYLSKEGFLLEEHVSPGIRITNAYSPCIDEYSLMQNMSKVRSTLRQFVRDWSSEGKHERDSAYDPILKSLDEYLPITKKYIPKILCPGSGLGRLPYEVAKKGYRSQGNEFSYFMLLASNFILNYYNKKNSLHIQPYCLNTLNRKKRDDHLKIIHIPDVNTYDKNILNTEFSMCAGELIEVYYNEKEQFDGVLTCFFLDTAKNIFMYIRTFAMILKPNSLWSNIGPLLYHYAEMSNEMSIELAWDEIKPIITKWFNLVEVKWIDNYYTTNINSMMQVQYHCVFFNAIRNTVPVEDN
ncbi:N2227-like protein, putative, partial [Hepatocystis sp. ex Piliocolobus tephrosceles]